MEIYKALIEHYSTKFTQNGLRCDVIDLTELDKFKRSLLHRISPYTPETEFDYDMEMFWSHGFYTSGSFYGKDAWLQLKKHILQYKQVTWIKYWSPREVAFVIHNPEQLFNIHSWVIDRDFWLTEPSGEFLIFQWHEGTTQGWLKAENWVNELKTNPIS